MKIHLKECHISLSVNHTELDGQGYIQMLEENPCPPHVLATCVNLAVIKRNEN